jgi:hypothetical protein
MAEIVITSKAPLTAQITFNDLEIAAIAFDASQSMDDPKPDPAQLFLDRTRQYINSMVARYHDAQAKLLLQKFNGATPEKQTAALQALDAA